MLLDIDHPVNLPSNNINYEEISRGSEGFVHDGGGGEGGGGVVDGGGGEEGGKGGEHRGGHQAPSGITNKV